MNQEIPVVSPVPGITLKERFLEIWKKFYSQKKVFWLFASLFSLIILITIAGIIFRIIERGQAPRTRTPNLTPAAGIIQTEKPKRRLDLAQEELIRLGDQIRNLDIKQQRLTPPAPNFKVDF